MSRIQIFWEKLRILVQLLRINLRTSVIVLVGLSLALSTITSSLIYIESKKTDYYLSALDQTSRTDRVEYSHVTINFQHFNTTTILALQEAFDKKISKRGLNNILEKQPLYPVTHFPDRIDFLNESIFGPFYGLNFNESILNDCVEGSYLPTTMNETILLTSSILALNIGDQFNVSFRDYLREKSFYNHTLKVTGFITPDSLRNSSSLRDIFLRGDRYLKKIAIITDLGKSIELSSFMNAEIRSLTNILRIRDFSIVFRFNFQVSTIDHTNIRRQLPNLISFLRTTDEFSLDNVYLERLYDGGITQMMDAFDEYNRLFFSFAFFCVPAFLLSILLGRFSLGLINEQRKKKLTLIRMRGVSTRFLVIALLGEALVIAVIASLISIILGVLGGLLISSTTGYLTFNFAFIPANLVFPQFYIILTVICGISLTIITYIWPMINVIKSSLTLLEQELPLPEKSKPRKFTSRNNLGPFLLVQGALGIFLLIFLVQIINTSSLNIERNQLFNLFLPIVQVLLLVSPFSFLVGFIVVYNRFIPSLLKKISNLFWKKDWGLLATASRNLSVNINVTSQVTLLIACTLSFLMVLSSLSISYYHHNIDSTFYALGADFRIDLVTDDNGTIQELEAQLNSIEGLTFTTISKTGFDVFDDNGIVQTILFLGIEENFHQVAHWRSYYDDQLLPDLVHSLFNSSESNPIIMDSATSREEGVIVKKGNKSIISNPNILEFSVEGVSDYWPGFIITRSSPTYYFITKRNLIENVSIAAHNSGVPVGYWTFIDRIWCKVLPGYDPDLLSSQISNVIESLEGLYYQNARFIIKSRNLSDQFLWLITNFNFLDSLIVVIIVIVLFALMRISSHTTELGLSRALGMKYKQVFLVMFIEPLLLFLISGISGGFVGLLLLTFFASLLAPRLLYAPPFILDFNIPVIILIYTIIFVIILLTGVVTSLRATRANISKILKAE